MTRIAGVEQPVGSLALGGNRLGSALDEDDSFELLDAFRDGGGVLIDTALVYADWLPDVERACSERTIGRWLRSRRASAEMVVATKGGHPALSDPGVSRLGPADLRADAEASLRHLGLDRLPLWWLHRDDPGRPVAEIVTSVQSLVEQGMLAAWGVCNWSAVRLGAACDFAATQGWAGPVADSAALSLAPPVPGSTAADLVTVGPALAALHRSRGLPLVAYSAQAKGWFDKRRQGTSAALDPLFDTATGRKAADTLSAIAERVSASPTEVALAALRLLPFPTVAVVGPGTVGQLASCRRAVDLDLGADEDAVRGLLSAAVEAAPQS